MLIYHPYEWKSFVVSIFTRYTVEKKKQTKRYMIKSRNSALHLMLNHSSHCFWTRNTCACMCRCVYKTVTKSFMLMNIIFITSLNKCDNLWSTKIIIDWYYWSEWGGKKLNQINWSAVVAVIWIYRLSIYRTTFFSLPPLVVVHRCLSHRSGQTKIEWYCSFVYKLSKSVIKLELNRARTLCEMCTWSEYNSANQ